MAEANMRRFRFLLLARTALGVFAAYAAGALGAGPAEAIRAAATAATAATAAAKPVDYYALTAADFRQLPEVAQRVKKDAVDVVLLEAAIFHQSNVERAKLKLPLFKHGLAMNLMARRHSTEMVRLQFFDHVSPTPDNATLAKRLKNVGLVNVTAGENLAVLPAKEMGSGRYITHDALDGNEVWYDEVTGKRVDYYTYGGLAETVVTQWMNSPAHHENMVHRAYVYLGVGVARGAYGDDKQDSFYMTQNFCATTEPKSETAAQAGLTANATPKTVPANVAPVGASRG
jgi:uncharacterized protein YkwD